MNPNAIIESFKARDITYIPGILVQMDSVNCA